LTRNAEVLPLFARLSQAEQERIFDGHTGRRIVLATNVAETSLTVPGMRHVVDSGLARISRYSVRGKVQRLPIEPISQASADQRKGRSGRESPGICIRLYAEDDFVARPPFTPPEVLRTNLASVILQMAALELGEPQEFPFVDPPDTRLINDGYKLLQELKAVDEARVVTSIGRQISTLPLDPRLPRMLLAASHHRCVAEMLIIAAFLAAQDPRERPAEAQAQADEKHAAFADPRSDFVGVLNLWKAFFDRSAALSGSQLRKWCRENFLSFIRMREWQELQRQLADIAGELALRPNQLPAEYHDLHQAILTGFLGNIGALDERREYEGARGSRFVIAPGTPLAAKPSKWVVAANLMETTRLYARMVAAVEPAWIEAAAEHLIKRSYSEPHWVVERGFVAAFESTSLYGLTLSSRRRVNYGSVAPREAQQIFVREALVEGNTRLRAPFVEQNRRLRREVEQLEAKLRRRDVLVDEQTLTDFYLQRLPEHVHSTATLEKWLRAPQAAASLVMTRQGLMRRDVPEVTATSHPDRMHLSSNELPLEYFFEPGNARDGITVTLPLPLLANAEPADFATPIPGWRVETITEILRALPKAVRKAFVPVPEHAARAAREIDSAHQDFHAALAEWITRTSGTPLTSDALTALPIPDALRFNIRVVDMNGALLAEGRDLLALKRNIRRVENERSGGRPDTVHRRWDFGAVPAQQVVQRRGLRFSVYPTLRDHGDGVELAEAGSAADAEDSLRPAVLRLAMLALPEQFKYARKRFADDRDIVLLGQGLNTARPLAESLAERAFSDCFLSEDTVLPRTAEQFEAWLDRRRSSFGDVVDRVLTHARETLRELRNVRGKLAALNGPAFQALQQDAKAQMQTLVPADFPSGVPPVLWQHLPRYLKALARRLEKAPGNQQRDAELAARVRPAMRAFEQLNAHVHRDEQHAEIARLQWLIEELRVSLFAQDLKTAVPVSEKRIAEQIARAQAPTLKSIP
jgi:ATP-dependent helicase HrpA